jgi:peptide/nickel transport system permease protein
MPEEEQRQSHHDVSDTTINAEDHVAVATQWQLMWWRFRKHRLAMAAAIVIIALYTVVIGAEFFAYSDPGDGRAERSLISPQRVHLFDDGRFNPHVYGLQQERDPQTFDFVYRPDPSERIPVRLFASGFEYKLFGIIPTDRHLIGVKGARAEETLFLLGTDRQGRDLWSRIVFATRLSLTIGLLAVAVSLFLGMLFGGLSGYLGGAVDTVVQRIIELVYAIPTIPLWMALAAALPRDWSIIQIYLAITIILSLIGWIELARVVRGRFLSLREEDFVMAAELAGSNRGRIIFRHMIPSFMSHIIASVTLALPAMILAETALSFLGIGLRPPAVSWGVLLQQAQNIHAVAFAPWLLLPAVPVIIAVLAFNFLGDGLRDAADPYSS